MSLVWMEGFDHEAGTTDLQNGIVVPTLAPGFASNGISAGFSIAINSSNTRWGVGAYVTATENVGPFQPGVWGFVAPFGSAEYTEGYYGCAINIVAGGTAYFSFYDIAHGVEQIFILISSFGSWSVNRRGNPNSTIASGFIPGFSVDWNYMEFYALIDSSSGAFALKCNGAPIYSGTGLNTAATANVYGNTISPITTFSGMGCGVTETGGGPANYVSFDDMYFNDTTGSAPYNTFLGDVRILTGKPNGAGTYTQFTPLSGANWQEVSESIVDGDTSYNYSNTVGNKDTFTQTGGIINSTVFGVQVTTYARKDDAINRQLANYIISGSTEVAGASHYMTSAYIYNKDIFIADPNTSAPWVYTNVNSLQIGYKLIS